MIDNWIAERLVRIYLDYILVMVDVLSIWLLLLDKYILSMLMMMMMMNNIVDVDDVGDDDDVSKIDRNDNVVDDYEMRN